MRIAKQLSQEKLGKIKDRIEQGKNDLKDRQKLHDAFLAEIDDKSRAILTKMEEIIFDYTNRFNSNGGWVFTSREITNTLSKYVGDNYLTYHILADEQGYHMQPEPPAGLKIGASREAEQRFLDEHKTELSLLHQAYMVKNDIIYNRRYTLKNPNRASVVEELRELLGYNNPIYVVIPKEPKTEITIKL